MAVLAIISTAVAAYVASSWNRAGKYEKSIIRHVNSPEEENALVTAEGIDLADVFENGRFSGNSNISDYSQYTWANFIDSTVLNYYSNRFESLKGKPLDMKFNYSASISKLDRIHAFYVSTVRIEDANGTRLDEYSARDAFAYANNSEIEEIQAEAIDFELANCFVVEMKLEYAEIYGNVAAFFSDVKQTAVLDENHKPILICVQTMQAIS